MAVENVIIIGSGISGYTAAIYAARANLKPVLVAGSELGGQLSLTTEVENFPGFPEGIQGPELTENTRKQAERFGTRVIYKTVEKLTKKADVFEVALGDETLQSTCVIVATGASARWLGMESEKKYVGRGVSSCATCDGFFYKDQVVAVIGGGDSSCEEANYLSKIASKVYMIHRRDELRASKIMQKRVLENAKVDMKWNSIPDEILGDDDKVTGVRLKDTKTGKMSEISVDGVFIAIGHVPNTTFLGGLVEVDEHGFIKTDRFTHTNVPGMFAAGDVQDPRYKQAITAAGSGCQAAIEVEKYLEALHD
ncbi:MAG: thioredoxin-disulfide reductase [Nanoarchaeota archaeon]